MNTIVMSNTTKANPRVGNPDKPYLHYTNDCQHPKELTFEKTLDMMKFSNDSHEYYKGKSLSFSKCGKCHMWVGMIR